LIIAPENDGFLHQKENLREFEIRCKPLQIRGIVKPRCKALKPSNWSNRSNPSNWRFFMNLTISGHHVEVTPAMRSYVTTKLDRITRHFDQVVDVKVLLSVENEKEKERRQHAECNIHVKGSDMFAQTAHSDLYAAIDELMDKLDRQVVRHKDRIQSHSHSAPKRLM
jgi:putative sigma-54 modulation protein